MLVGRARTHARTGGQTGEPGQEASGAEVNLGEMCAAHGQPFVADLRRCGCACASANLAAAAASAPVFQSPMPVRLHAPSR